MPPLPKLLGRHSMAAALATGVGLASWIWAGPLQSWELVLAGRAQEWRGPRPLRSGVTIVAIDDYSLQQAANADLSDDPLLRQLTGWPWPRAIQALVVDRLHAAGVRAVALDLLFETPSLRGAADDAALAAVLRRHRPRTVLAAQVQHTQGGAGGLALSQPVPMLLAAAGEGAVGLLNGAAESDGAIQRRPGDHAAALQRELGPAVPPGLGVSLLRASARPDRSAPPTAAGNWLPMLSPYGPPGSVPTLPIWQLLEPRAHQALRQSGRLRDQLVLIGPTAALFQDRHRSPFGGSEGMPGVELLATEVANRIEGRALWFWLPGRGWALGLGLVALLAALLAERWQRPLQRVAALGGVALALGGLAVLLAGWLDLAPHLFSTAAVVALVAVVSGGEATTRLQWQRLRLRQALGRYLSPAVAAEIADQPSEADGLLGGRTAEVVVMIADIRGFTERTRRMSQAGQARQLVDQLNEYLTEVVTAIHNEGGTVDKFIGDAALAVFGAPLNRGSAIEASAALRAARDLQNRLQALNRRWKEQHKECWEQVIVLNFGSVISGNVGSISRMDYTVIGDAVNATSRLESVAKASNRNLVMTAAFADLMPCDEQLELLGNFELRGYGTTTLYALTEPPP